MAEKEANRSMADWLVIRVWTLQSKCRRARNRTVRTKALVTLPMPAKKGVMRAIAGDHGGLAVNFQVVCSTPVELNVVASLCTFSEPSVD